MFSDSYPRNYHKINDLKSWVAQVVQQKDQTNSFSAHFV